MSPRLPLLLAFTAALAITTGCQTSRPLPVATPLPAGKTSDAKPSDAKPAAPQALPRERKIYAFEHRVLPRITHNSRGAFYSDLSRGLPPALVDLAVEVVDERFAKSLVVTPTEKPRGVLIAFEAPREMTHCYFAFLTRSGDTCRYFTLEKTLDLGGDGTKTMFCEWNSEGGHRNYGARSYTDSASFLADLDRHLNAPATTSAK